MKKTKALSAALLAVCGPAGAATLGELEIVSTENGFIGEIPVFNEGLPGEEKAEVSIPSSSDYEALGLTRGSFASNAIVSLETKNDGRRFVQIVSPDYPKEPADLLVELKWPGGMALKEVSVSIKSVEETELDKMILDTIDKNLVDGEANAEPVVVAEPVVGTSMTAPSPEKRELPDEETAGIGNRAIFSEPSEQTGAFEQKSRIFSEEKPQTRNIEQPKRKAQKQKEVSQEHHVSSDVAQGAEIIVKPGSSLMTILSVYSPSERAKALLAVVEDNPQAFRKGNANIMFAGAKIRLPDEQRLSGISKSDADEMILLQTRAYAGNAQAISSLAKRTSSRYSEGTITVVNDSENAKKSVLDEKQGSIAASAKSNAKNNGFDKKERKDIGDKEKSAEEKPLSVVDAPKANIDKAAIAEQQERVEQLSKNIDALKTPASPTANAKEEAGVVPALSKETSPDSIFTEPKMEEPAQPSSVETAAAFAPEKTASDEAESKATAKPERKRPRLEKAPTPPVEQQNDDIFSFIPLGLNGMLLAGGTLILALIGTKVLLGQRKEEATGTQSIQDSFAQSDFEGVAEVQNANLFSEEASFVNDNREVEEAEAEAEAREAISEELSSEFENIGPSTETGVEISAELDNLFGTASPAVESNDLDSMFEAPTADTFVSQAEPKVENEAAFDFGNSFNFDFGKSTENESLAAKPTSTSIEDSLPGFEAVPQWSMGEAEESKAVISNFPEIQNAASELMQGSPDSGEILDLYDEMAKAFEDMGDVENAKTLREEAQIAKKMMTNETA